MADLVARDTTTYLASKLGTAEADVVIGGNDPAKFVPNINVGYAFESSRERYWFNLNAKGVVVSAERQAFDSKSVSLAVGDITEKYELGVDALTGEQCLKWLRVFARHPGVNTWVHELKFSPGVEFCYQGPLNKLNHLGQRCRPAEVVGSYAVYCNGRGHFKATDGSTIVNYKAGKLGMIYPPWFTDADGKRMRGTINIEKDVYRVTVDADWFAAARFPVVANDTFGYESIGGTAQDDANPDTVYAGLDAVAPAGTLTNISWYINTYGTSAAIRFGLYSESGGSPNTRLVYDVDTWLRGTATEWKTNPVAWSYGMSVGTQYWASVCPVATEWLEVFYDDTGAADLKWEDNVDTPATAGSLETYHTDLHISVYGTYELSAPVVAQASFQFFAAGDELPHWHTPVIEAADVTHTNNTSTTTTSKAISYPAHSAGDLLIQFIVSDAAVTHTLPAQGPNAETVYTIVEDAIGGSNGPCLSAIYWVAAQNTGAGTLTWTLSANETCSGECIVVPAGEFDATTPIGTIGSAGTSNTDAVVATMPSLTPNKAGGRIVAIGGCDTDPMGDPFSQAGWTDRAGAARDDGAQNSFVATRDVMALNGVATGTADFDINATDSYACIGFVVNAPADGRASLGIVGADPTLEVDTDYGWQVRVENTGAVTTEDTYKLQYKLGAGAWTDITDASSVVRAYATADFANGADVPEYITGNGTYVTDNNAALDTTGSLTLAAVLGAASAFEAHLNFRILSGDVADEDTIQLRVVDSAGDALDAYTDTPTITVNEGGGAIQELAGSIAATTSLLGASVADRNIVGSVAATSTLVGASVADRTIIGLVVAASTLAGLSGFDFTVSGAIDAVSSLAGAMIADKNVAGIVEAESTLSGASVADRTVAGTIAATSAFSGLTVALRDVAGTIDAISTLLGAMETAGVFDLQGSIAAESALAGAAVADRSLGGAVAAQSALSGLVMALRDLGGIIAAESALTGDLELAIIYVELQGVIDAASALQGAIGAFRGVSGTVAAESALTGAMVADRGLTGAIAGQSTLAGTLRALRELIGMIQAVSTLTGNLTAGELLYGEMIELTARLLRSVDCETSLGREIDLDASLRRRVDLMASLL